MPKFSDINFRYTDAEEEKLYSPELIEKAYVDIDQLLKKINLPEKFLVIGPKGSGKTALSSKLSLMGSSQWDLFVEDDILEQFEYQLLKKTGGQKGTLIGGALTTWQVILLLRLIPLLLKDEQFKGRNAIINDFANSLKKYGLTESNSLISIVQYTSRRGIFSKLKSIISELNEEIIEEDKYSVKDPAALLASIKEVFKQISPAESRYYLILDGLDYVLRETRNNCPYIGDLINAVRQLNIFFASIKINAKVIILIRNEVLQIIPDPNLTKRVHDNGISLKWYDNVRSPFDTSLLEIIEKRAHLAGFRGSIRELWYQWFPKTINNAGSLEFVLRNTRFLPRDLISFFREVQGVKKEPPFNRIDVLTALNNYSEWFLQELSDAIVGFVSENIRNNLSGIISSLGREFDFSQFQQKLDELGFLSSDESAEQIARELFNTSWIGNKWLMPQGSPRYSWRHRKTNAKFDPKRRIVVHPGLWKALTLI